MKMVDRYSRVFYLEDNLYAEGSPVLIEAGALLKDNQVERTIAQLKLKNISSSVIKAVTVSITPKDTAGRINGNSIEHEYLDLTVTRDQSFGVKEPILISNNSTRAFSITVIEVVFEDNSVWMGTSSPWEPLISTDLLDATLNDIELVKQYKLVFGNNCKYFPAKDRDLWYCSCGALNKITEDCCHKCGLTKAIIEADLEELKFESHKRVTEEKEKAETEEKAKLAQKQAHISRMKQVSMIATPIIVIFILACLFIPGYMENQSTYNEAVNLANSGEYAAAIELFESLGNFKDSAEQAAVVQYAYADYCLDAGKYYDAIDLCKNLEDVEYAYEYIYNEANALLEAEYYDEAIELFDLLGDYSDASIRILEATYAKADALLADGEYDLAMILFESLGDYGDAEDRLVESTNFYLEDAYSEATDLLSSGDYYGAIEAFENLDGYRDSEDMATEAAYTVASILLESESYEGVINALEEYGYEDYAYEYIYSLAGELWDSGENYSAAIAYGSLGDYLDAKDKSFELWAEIVNRKTIAAGYSHTVAIKADNTVVAVGYSTDGSCDVESWSDIVSVAAGDSFTVGLKSDGTVVATGENDDGQCNVENWTNIVAISAGLHCTIGLKSDGTIVATGSQYGDIGEWTNIKNIASGWYHTIGLKSDGSVVTTNEDYGDVSSWAEIVDIVAGSNHTVGLKADGTVIAAGFSNAGQCDVDGWSNIISLAAYDTCTIGVKEDGTVVYTGLDSTMQSGRLDILNWTNIVAIAVGYTHSVGLKSDGTAVAVGVGYSKGVDVEDWKDIKLPE